MWDNLKGNGARIAAVGFVRPVKCCDILSLSFVLVNKFLTIAPYIAQCFNFWYCMCIAFLTLKMTILYSDTFLGFFLTFGEFDLTESQ